MIKILPSLAVILAVSGCATTSTNKFNFDGGVLDVTHSGCGSTGVWSNTSDQSHQSYVELVAYDENGNTIGTKRLSFYPTRPGGSSDSKDNGRVNVWDGEFNRFGLSCNKIHEIGATAHY